MTTRDWLAWAMAFPLAALFWQPDWMLPALVASALILVMAYIERPHRVEVELRQRRTRPVRSISWLPGIGLGVSLRAHPHPYAFLSILRIRR